MPTSRILRDENGNITAVERDADSGLDLEAIAAAVAAGVRAVLQETNGSRRELSEVDVANSMMTFAAAYGYDLGVRATLINLREALPAGAGTYRYENPIAAVCTGAAQELYEEMREALPPIKPPAE
jgi:nitroreductase